jgi:hypothetical protein
MDPIDSTYSIPLSTEPDIQFLADMYNVGDRNNEDNNGNLFKVEPLDETDLADLNHYVQTEINPFIIEEDRKLPIFLAGPIMTFTPRYCADDFCCTYTMNICQEKNGDARLYNKVIEESNIPQLCLDGDLTPIDFCPPSVYQPIPIPCVSNCNPPRPQIGNVVEVESITKISIVPNPTSNGTILTMAVVSDGNLTITLVNEAGQELMELHNAYTKAGDFRKNFSMSKYPIGVYFLKISHNGKVKLEKLVRN